MSATGVVDQVKTADGVKIVYESAGTGEPTVVFLHGIFGDRGYFKSQVEHLAGRRRAISLDFRAHGDSDRTQTVSIESFADDVIAVLDAAGATGAVLCGHSMAGGVALEVAARRPELVFGVVMLDGVIFFPEQLRRGAVDGLLPALSGEGWLDALRGYFARLIDPASPEVTARVMAGIGGARRELAVSFFDSIFGAGYAARQERYAGILASLRRPLMYVTAMSPTDLGRLQASKPDAMIGHVVGSGHWLMLSAADQVNAMLDRFLEVVAQPGD